MPRIVDYPICSWEKANQLAQAVQDLGGECSPEACAAQLGMAASGGGFNSIKNGAAKFGLIVAGRKSLSTTEHFSKMSLAYDQEKKKKLERDAFLSPPLFRTLWDKYRGRKLPDILGQVLAADFGVNKAQSEKIANYFVSGAKSVGLSTGDGKLVAEIRQSPMEDEVTNDQENLLGSTEPASQISDQSPSITVTIKGCGLQSVIQLNDVEDMELVESTLKAVRRKLEKNGRTALTPSPQS